MFKISTKGDYGLLLLSALAEAMRSGEKFVSLAKIAREKHLSLPYLSQIIIPLKTAGLVSSKEGRDGGYCLAKAPEKISLISALEVLEGPVSPVRCCGNKKGVCGSEAQCTVKSTWHDANMVLANFLRTKTLADTISNMSLRAKRSNPVDPSPLARDGA